MKAIVYEKYGSPTVLELREVEKPAPKDDEVLIKIHAASVNNWDWDRLTGKPYLYRLISGISTPKLKILGADIAGKVEEIGKDVTKFKPGEEVYGDLCQGNWGGFAEYVLAPQALIEHGTYRLADSVSDDQSTFIEPLACVVHGMNRAGLRPGSTRRPRIPAEVGSSATTAAGWISPT